MSKFSDKDIDLCIQVNFGAPSSDIIQQLRYERNEARRLAEYHREDAYDAKYDRPFKLSRLNEFPWEHDDEIDTSSKPVDETAKNRHEEGEG